MNEQNLRASLLDQLISLPDLLEYPQLKTLENDYPQQSINDITEHELQKLRRRIETTAEVELGHIDIDPNGLAETIANRIRLLFNPSLTSAINASGIILHSALGRAPLCQEAQDALARAAQDYVTLTIDPVTGKRWDRSAHVENLLCYLTGAEAATVVNNNAGALMLVLNTMAFEREVVISRGQLVEIDSSFRIPDVIRRSGAIMVEVGATNKTHPRDFEHAINENTALLLYVHPSNYQIVGFTSEVSLKPLVDLGHEHNLPVIHNIGSGCLIDFEKYGLPPEPRVQDSIAAGADLVMFSGDKILSGPQSGIIVGKKKYIDRLRKNPLARALRCDKLTIAALEATLKLYLDEEHLRERHPVLRLLTTPVKTLANRGRTLRRQIKEALEGKCEIKMSDGFSQLGSGSLPAQYIPTRLIALKPLTMSAETLATKLRENTPPIFARLAEDELLLDLRTLRSGETKLVARAIKEIFAV